MISRYPRHTYTEVHAKHVGVRLVPYIPASSKQDPAPSV